VYYDFSYDRNFKKSDSIFLYSRIIPDAEFFRTVVTVTESQKLAATYPEVKKSCYLWTQYETFDIEDESRKEQSIQLSSNYVSEDGFADMFTPEILVGDIHQAFIEGNALLTKNAAKEIFGDINPIGKIFFRHNSDQPITVAAVCKDFPDNCSLKNGVYLYQTEQYPMAQWAYITYLKIDPENKTGLLKKLNSDQFMQKGTKREEQIWQYELTALPDIHLGFPVLGEGSLTTTLSLLAIGIFLLIIGYTNFLSFSIAMAPLRVKGFNIRRILGESSWALKLSIVMEAVFLALIAFAVSLFIIGFLNSGVIKDFFRADLSLSKNWILLFYTGGICMFSGFVAGIYPAFYATSFNPAMALSGSFSGSKRVQWLKNALIVVQFVMAIFLITITLFVERQHDYLRNKNWGINTENVLYLNTAPIMFEVDNFITELKRNPDIVDLTYGQYVPGDENIQGWGRNYNGKEILMNVWPVKSDFFAFFGINLIDGQGFSAEGNNTNKMIFNETFLKEYEFNNLTGTIFKDTDQNVDFEIAGIVEDFNFKSLRDRINPLAFISVDNMIYGGSGGRRWTFVRTNGSNTLKAIDYIRDTWKKFSNEPVEVLSLDETLGSLYEEENNLAKLVSTCGIIAIIVAIMGVYGLILFNAKSKRKTIALHKVHGASKSEVILMLNHNLIVQFVVAYIIAVPPAYYVVNRWLEGFAYKTPIHWWVFILGGLIVFLISLATVSWQSYRAASINPIDGIKSE
jgi:putative ABC transport system permease protein